MVPVSLFFQNEVGWGRARGIHSFQACPPQNSHWERLGCDPPYTHLLAPDA